MTLDLLESTTQHPHWLLTLRPWLNNDAWKDTHQSNPTLLWKM